MQRSIPKRLLEVLAMSILGTAFVLNVYILYGNALWWQWGFGLLLSMAGGLLVAIAISSLLRRPAATDQDEAGNDEPSPASPRNRKGEPHPPQPPDTSGGVQAIRLQDAIVSLPGIGREKARVARTFGVSTLRDFVGLDGAAKESLRKALGPSLFDRVSSIAAQVSATAGK